MEPVSLPAELILEILEAFAYLSVESALTVCLIATWSLRTGLIALYRVVFIKSNRDLDKFMNITATPRPSDDNNTVVKRLQRGVGQHVRCMLNTCAYKHELMNCIHNCPNVENLAVRGVQILSLTTLIEKSYIENQSLGEDAFLPQVKKLTLLDGGFLRILPRSSEADRFLCNLTHLVLNGTSLNISIYLPIHRLKNLSHIAMPIHDNLGRDTSALFDRACGPLLSNPGEKLKMIVLHIAEQELAKVIRDWRHRDWVDVPFVQNLVLDANRKDQRLYAALYNPFGAYTYRAWERDARGEGSIWDDAVLLLQKAKSLRGNIRRSMEC